MPDLHPAIPNYFYNPFQNKVSFKHLLCLCLFSLSFSIEKGQRSFTFQAMHSSYLKHIPEFVKFCILDIKLAPQHVPSNSYEQLHFIWVHLAIKLEILLIEINYLTLLDKQLQISTTIKLGIRNILSNVYQKYYRSDNTQSVLY